MHLPTRSAAHLSIHLNLLLFKRKSTSLASSFIESGWTSHPVMINNVGTFVMNVSGLSVHELASAVQKELKLNFLKKDRPNCMSSS